MANSLVDRGQPRLARTVNFNHAKNLSSDGRSASSSANARHPPALSSVRDSTRSPFLSADPLPFSISLIRGGGVASSG